MKNIFILYFSILFLSFNAFCQENKIILKVNFYQNYKSKSNNNLLNIKINDSLINITTFHKIILPIEKCELKISNSNLKYCFDISEFINKAKNNDTLIVEINISTISKDNNLIFYYDIDYNIYSNEINYIKDKNKYLFFKKIGFCVDNFIWIHPIYHNMDTKNYFKLITKDRYKK